MTFADGAGKYYEESMRSRRTVFIQTMHHRIGLKDFDGWHLRTARAIRRYAGVESILINPGDFRKPILKIIDSFPVIFVPYRDLNIIPIHRWGHVSFSWGEIIMRIIHRISKYVDRVYLLIHAPRAFNSMIAYMAAKAAGANIVLQHHGEKNYYYYLLRSVEEGIRNPVKILDYYLMHLIDCRMARESVVVYSLAGYDVKYYREICRARSRLSTMGVFFEDIRPSRERCCDKVKNLVYVGGLYRNDLKGSDILVRIYKAIGGIKSGYKLTIVGPIKDPVLYSIAKSNGIIFTRKIANKDVIRIISENDAYVLTARKALYWGGVGVAPMEALALNLPVVSPTLSHIPKEDRAMMGITIPWADTVSFQDLVILFRKSLEYLETSRLSPRVYAAKYFDWRNIVEGYRRDLEI